MVRYKKLLLATLFLLPLSELRSQDLFDKSDDEGESYRILNEAPSKDLFVARVQADALVGGYTAGNGGLGVDAYARFDEIFVNGGFGVDFYRTGISNSLPSHASAEDGLSSNLDIYAIGGYSLYQEKKDQEVSIAVAQERKANTEVTYVLPAETQVDDRVNAELGFQFGKTSYDLGNVNFENEFTRADASSTMLNYAMLRAGASVQRTFNTKIESKTYGVNSSKARTRFFGHALLPLQQETAPLEFKDRDATDEPLPSLEDETETSSLGVVIGYQTDVLEPMHYGYGFDLGVFPGLKGSGLSNAFFRVYFNVGFADFMD